MHDEQSQLATASDAEREYAANAGRVHPGQAWILSPRDVWYPNPSYCGPAVPHPDDEPNETE
jgi:hypothetical protein